MNREEWLRDKWREMFYESQNQGANQFPVLWLKVNNTVVQNCTEHFDLRDQQVRTLISVVILETLRVVKGKSGD